MHPICASTPAEPSLSVPLGTLSAPLCNTPSAAPLRTPSAPPPHPPLHLLRRLLSRLDDSQPLYLGDFGSTEEARHLGVPRSASTLTPPPDPNP